MQSQTASHIPVRKTVSNPRANQTFPQPKPALPHSPGGRFIPEFRPHPPQSRP